MRMWVGGKMCIYGGVSGDCLPGLLVRGGRHLVLAGDASLCWVSDRQSELPGLAGWLAGWWVVQLVDLRAHSLGIKKLLFTTRWRRTITTDRAPSLYDRFTLPLSLSLSRSPSIFLHHSLFAPPALSSSRSPSLSLALSLRFLWLSVSLHY